MGRSKRSQQMPTTNSSILGIEPMDQGERFDQVPRAGSSSLEIEVRRRPNPGERSHSITKFNKWTIVFGTREGTWGLINVKEGALLPSYSPSS